MLSFLHEQEFEDSPAAKRLTATEDIPADRAVEAQEQEYLTVAAKDKNVRKTTTLLAVLFGISLLCLWLMIKKSTPPTTSAATVTAEEAQIEMAFQRLAGVRSEMFDRMDQIIKKFYEFSNVQQVEVSKLVKNPFKHDRFSDDLEEASDSEEFDIAAAAKDLELLSICQSDQGNCCMIDDKILYEGDSIRNFKVSQIGDSFVKLEQRSVSVEGAPKRDAALQESDKERLGTQIILKLSE